MTKSIKEKFAQRVSFKRDANNAISATYVMPNGYSISVASVVNAKGRHVKAEVLDRLFARVQEYAAAENVPLFAD